MRLRLIIAHLVSAVFVALPAFINLAQAEVWRCSGVYTNSNVGKTNCKPIEGSKVCGSEGNKYFAPRRMSGTTDQACVTTGKSKSPFVDMDNLPGTQATAKKRRQNSAKEEQSPRPIEGSIMDSLNSVEDALGSGN